MSVRLLVLVAACVSSGAALRCYTCISEDGEYCSDTEIRKGRIDPAECSSDIIKNGLDVFDSIAQGIGIPFDDSNSQGSFGTHVRSQLQFSCAKIYYSNLNGRGRVERKCVLKGSGVCNNAGSEVLGGRVDYCSTCYDRDGCNSAGRLGGNYLWLLPLLALLRWH